MVNLFILFNKLNNPDKLVEFYHNNTHALAELQEKYPDWRAYLDKYLSAEIQAELRERGIPI